MIKQRFSKIQFHTRKYGIGRTLKRILFRMFNINAKNSKTAKEVYQKWILKNEPTEEELQQQKKQKWNTEPKISIIVPMYHPDENFFLELLNSLLVQTYSNWELCIADGSEEQNEMIFAMCSRYSKIKYKFLEENRGIAENTNAALEMAGGDFIAFLDHDDCLPPFSLYEIAKVIEENPEVDFIYSDEDKIDEWGRRFDPYFKPDYSPETLECQNYITHFVAIRKTFVNQIGKLDKKFDGAQDFDFVLRATENTKNIVHIPKVLYHWRAHKNSTADTAQAKEYAYEAGRKAVEEHLKRTGKKGIVKNPREVPGIYQIQYEIEDNLGVSIIILDKNDKKSIKRSLKTILTLTTYKNYEVLILSNNPNLKKQLPQNDKIKIIQYEEKSNNDFEILNFGTQKAGGDFVVLLDCHTKLLTPNWLECLLGYAQKEEIGVVGVKMYNQQKILQNLEMSYELANNKKELLGQLPCDFYGYFNQQVATRNVNQIAPNCFIAKKEYYEKGFFQDVDFCSKILEKGYRVVYNPYVELIQYERKQK